MQSKGLISIRHRVATGRTDASSLLVLSFRAMACPCEILVDSTDRPLAAALLKWAESDALRIEAKFSRYRNDNIVHAINTNQGKPIRVDDETAQLLNFSATCHELSDGLFDITAGILRKAWAFGSDVSAGTRPRPPTQQQIDSLLPLVGWHQVDWHPPLLTLPPGMQIDLGGIGKEYAVDRAVQALRELTDRPFLVNYGGDLHASGAPDIPLPVTGDLARTKPPQNQVGWHVGVDTDNTSTVSAKDIWLQRGALCTSGNAYRHIDVNGKRYGHILDPRSGWPVANAPQSVTVAGNSCSEAGILATTAMLQGKDAESYLDNAGAHYWCYRE